jgi:hypothetical protein
LKLATLGKLAIRADFAKFKRGHGIVQIGVNLKERIHIGQVQQLTHERTWTGYLQIRLLALRVIVQKNQLANACAIDGRDAAKIENDPATLVEDFADHVRKRHSLVTIDNSALAMND